jgi:hypothetical protein
MVSRTEPKTRPTDVPVVDFLATVESPDRRVEAERAVALMTAVTGTQPLMWGTSIVGWGETAGDVPWPVVGFAPRKAQHVFYLFDDYSSVDALLARLGPHSLGRSCLYIKRLEAIDEQTLSDLVLLAWRRSISA